MRAHMSGVHLLYSSTHNQLDFIIVSPISLSSCVAGGIIIVNPNLSAKITIYVIIYVETLITLDQLPSQDNIVVSICSLIQH